MPPPRKLASNDRTVDGELADSRALHGLLGGLRGFDGHTETSVIAALAVPGPSLGRGDIVGRYVITARLGEGGMGVVFAAYDPELDRKVALKLLLPSSRDAAQGRARLLREAQALAQLAHPNVVAIHDVGTLGEQVWLAMEFIAGQTLTAWMKAGPRGWREVLAVFRRAGEGLAAAHAAGLVHRDFKPDNVMVGEDGRVRVMDFGLARAGQGEPPLRETLEDAPHATSGALGRDVTRAGTLLGTPGYMSPEQWLSDPTDARTDQFSYCVALWEALYGERPFAGETLPALVSAVTEGRRRAVHAGSSVPAWLRRAVQRGLSVAPAGRWPSMPALLAILASGAGKRRRNLGLSAALGVCLAVAGGLGWRTIDHARRVGACEAEGAGIYNVWSEAARARIAAALEAGSFDRVAPFIDRFAATWAAAQTHSCTQYTVEADDPALARAARECLLEARWSLEGVIQVLAEADAATAVQAVPAAAALPQIDPCLQASWLASRPRAPQEPQARAEVAAIRREIEQLHARRFGEDHAVGLARARALKLRAEALGWAPLAAHATLVAGDFTGRGGDLQGEVRLLEDAFFLAVGAGDEALAADAAIGLTHTVGDSLAHPDEGLRWGRYATAQLARLRGGSELRVAALDDALAAVHFGRGEHDEAQRLSELAVAIRERTLGPDHPELASSLLALADVYQARGAVREAVPLYERAWRIWRASLGASHPSTARAIHNLASAHRELGAPGPAPAR